MRNITETGKELVNIGNSPELETVFGDDSTETGTAGQSLAEVAPTKVAVVSSAQAARPKKDGGDLIVIKLRDLDAMTVDGKTIEFVIPATTTISDYLTQVTARTSLTTDVVNVVYQTSNGDAFDLSHFPPDSDFSALGIFPSREKTYSFCLMKKRRPRPAVIAVEEPEETTSNLSRTKVVDPTNENNEEDDELLHREFVGLKNQQQTCYLNSLLQSFFFCPEFRNFIYNQTVPYDPKKKSVILALQKIFLQLQFSVRTAIETDELTRTFGWKEDHDFVQHDIEELYRALLDHLGDELKRNGQSAHGDSLFGGLVNDYVKCLKCHQQNSKIELSLGISLPVRAFGEKLVEPTLEEALRNFVQVEVLNHPNQYHCERCSALVDAEKGMAFHKLPYFLSLQLRRWEFDLTILARRKINDKICFPFVLNMDPFMPSNDNGEKNSDKVPGIDSKVIGAQLPSMALGHRSVHSRPQAKIKNQDIEKRQKIENTKGGHIYELLAVWVHEGGSSHRGHYYSYVYDFEKCSWYLCNDSYVRKSSEEEVKKTFGGNSSFGNYEFEKGEAYMLIYRRRDSELNTLPMTRDDMPEHTKELWSSMEVNDRKVHEAELYGKRVRRVRLCRRKSDGWEVDTVEAAFDKMTSLQLTASAAFKIFHPETEVDPSTVRLVRFNPKTLITEDSWEGLESEPFGTVVRRQGDIELETVLLEVKSPKQPFEPYAMTDGILKVNLVDWKVWAILRTAEVHVPNLGIDVPLPEIQAKIASAFDIPLENLVLVLRMDRHIGNILITEVQTLLTQFHNGGSVVELMVQNVDDVDIDDFLEWSTQYCSSYCFNIECQLPPVPLQRARYRSETEPQFEFDQIDTPVVCNGHVPKISGQETKLVRGGEYFHVQSREKIASDWEKLRVRVSPGMTMAQFNQQLSLELNQPEADFLLYGVTGGQVEVEYTPAQRNTSLRDFEYGNFKFMRTRLGRKLRPGEVRVPIYLLDFARYKEASELLTEIVLHTEMTGSEVKLACIQAVRHLFSVQELSKTPYFRVRRKKGVFPGRIIRDSTKFSDIYLNEGEIFVQPILIEDTLSEKEFHVLIRHWQPNRFLLGEPFEIKVTHDYSQKVELLIRDEVGSATKIDLDHLEYTVPELDVDYPYDLNPLVLQEKSSWKKFGIGRITNVHTDRCVLIVKDSTEIGRELTKDERKAYSKEIDQCTVSWPKIESETGLCINLARTPPQ